MTDVDAYTMDKGTESTSTLSGIPVVTVHHR